MKTDTQTPVIPRPTQGGEEPLDPASCSPSEKFQCWCGVEDPYFADEPDGLDDTCGGMGVLSCRCGGDICVCHNHGETECPGCDDCEDDDDDIYSYEDFEENAELTHPESKP